MDQGRAAEAEQRFRRGLASWEKALGPEHELVAAQLAGLARALRQLDRADEAEPLLRRALDIRTKTLGPEHAETQALRDELAALLDAR